MSIIFFLTEGMLRHMKINVSFGPSSGTDMSNFRPWLMDYVGFKLGDVLTYIKHSTRLRKLAPPHKTKSFGKTTHN